MISKADILEHRKSTVLPKIKGNNERDVPKSRDKGKRDEYIENQSISNILCTSYQEALEGINLDIEAKISIQDSSVDDKMESVILKHDQRRQKLNAIEAQLSGSIKITPEKPLSLLLPSLYKNEENVQALLSNNLIVYKTEEKVNIQSLDKNQSIMKGINSNLKKTSFRPKDDDLFKDISKGVLETDLKLPDFHGVTSLSSSKGFANFMAVSCESAIEPKVFLKAEPATLHFTDYEPYKEYKKKLTIQNTSKFSQIIRMKYRSGKSNFFKFELIDSPARKDGLISSGLCNTYMITFYPNSLGKFAECLSITSNLGSSLAVDIIANQPSPSLSLPHTLLCGQCQPFSKVRKTFEFTNNGGAGIFYVMDQSEKRTAFEIFDKFIPQTDNGEVSCGVFSVKPRVFPVPAGGRAKLTISYSPTDIQSLYLVDQVFLRLACNNCEIYEYTLRGTCETPKVEILSGQFLNSKNDSHCNRWKKDEEYSFCIAYGLGNPQHSQTCVLKIKNPTGLGMDYFWVQNDFRFYSKEKLSDSAFKFNPCNGTLLPWEQIDVTITFSPKSIGDYDILASLNLFQNNQPNVEKSLTRVRLIGTSIAHNVVVSQKIIALPPGFCNGECYSTTLELVNYSFATVEYCWKIVDINENELQISIKNGHGILECGRVTKVDIDMKAYIPSNVQGKLICEINNQVMNSMCVLITGKVNVKPRSLFIDSKLLDFGILRLGEKGSLSVPLVNTNPYTVGWNLKSFNDEVNYNLYFEPSSGLLQANETCTVDISYVPYWYHRLTEIISVYMEYLAIPQVDNQKCLTDAFLINPVLMSSLHVLASVQTPRIILENNQNSFSCFRDVPISWNLSLRNVRTLETQFEFKDEDNDSFKISFSPNSGILLGGEETQVSISICFKRVGKFRGLNVQGVINNMIEDHGYVTLVIDALVKEHEFSFSILENDRAWIDFDRIKGKNARIPQSKAHLRLDFGLSCPIMEVRTRTLRIRNLSAIEANYSIVFVKYAANCQCEKPKTAQENLVSEPVKSNIPNLLHDSASALAAFTSKNGLKYLEKVKAVRSTMERTKTILSHGKGAAFQATPSLGKIKPWGEILVHITSYNNNVGIFNDEMICKIQDITKEFPVRLGVIGTPVKVSGAQLISKEKEVLQGGIDVEKLNFGTRLVNPNIGESDGIRLIQKAHYEQKDQIISKVIQVDNNSPNDVYLEWKVYIKHLLTDFSAKITLEMILKAENYIENHDLGIFAISPSYMTIPAFKSANLKCTFNNAIVGNLEAIILADVALYQKDGSFCYAPKKLGNGRMTVTQSTPREFIESPTVTLESLCSMAMFGIKGKSISPKLSLDHGEEIVIKRKHRGSSQKRTVVAFLENRTDAICHFSLSAIPFASFKVAGSKKCLAANSLQNDLNYKPIYELKQMQQITINVEFSPEEAEHIQKETSKKNLQLFESTQTLSTYSLKESRGTNTMSKSKSNSNLLSKTRQGHKSIDNLLAKNKLLEAPKTDGRKRSITSLGVSSQGVTFLKSKTSGKLVISFSNGMEQEIPIIVD